MLLVGQVLSIWIPQGLPLLSTVAGEILSWLYNFVDYEAHVLKILKFVWSSGDIIFPQRGSADPSGRQMVKSHISTSAARSWLRYILGEGWPNSMKLYGTGWGRRGQLQIQGYLLGPLFLGRPWNLISPIQWDHRREAPPCVQDSRTVKSKPQVIDSSILCNKVTTLYKEHNSKLN